MKKLLMCFLSIAMFFSVVGCSNDKKDEPSANNEVTGEVTLKIAHNMDFVTIPDAVVEAGNRLNEKYAAEGRDLVIKFEKDYRTIDWTEYHNNIVFSHKTDDAPDIFSLSGDTVGMVDAGILTDISDIVTDAFVEDIFTPYLVDGAAYGMPFDLPVRVLYYNKKALLDYGWTEEEVLALPEKISSGEFTFEQFMQLTTELKDSGVVEWGLAHRPGAGGDFLDIFSVLGGEYYDETGKMVFDEEALLRFFEFTYDNANVSKITPQDLNQQGWGSINTMVGDGSAFAYYRPMYSSVYVAGAVDKTPADLVNDISFVTFPVSEFNDTPFVTAAPQGMGISSQTKYPEICKDLFVELANGSQDMLAYHASEIFTLSSVKEANKHEYITTNPVLKEVTYMADFARVNPAIDGFSVYTSELHKQIVLLELGQTTAAEAVKEMKTQIELNVDSSKVIFK